MNLSEIIPNIQGVLLTNESTLEKQITSGFVGDLLSVVMSKAKSDCIWVTIQGHLNIVAVASLVDMSCIVVTEGFAVDATAIEKANEENIAIISTKYSSYTVVSKLHELGID